MGTNVYVEDCCQTQNSQYNQQTLLRNEPRGHRQVNGIFLPSSLIKFFHSLIIFAKSANKIGYI